MTMTMANPREFPDVPDLQDVAADNDRNRPPTMHETCVEIAQLLKRRSVEGGDIKPVNLATIQVVLEAYTELILRETARTGRYRLPKGFGTFQLQRIAGSKTPRQVPGVGATPRDPTVKIRYVAGVAVDELLQRQGIARYREAREGEREYHFPERDVPTIDDLANG